MIEIQQALFGYKEGHNLVVASIEFDARTRQFLANMTDGSGPDKAVVFDDGFTGLPVPNTPYYALFCTWPAPEMIRPGCVWSHVLLLDVSTLALINDLSSLRGLFLRPAIPAYFPVYQQPLALSEHAESGMVLSFEEQQNARLLIYTLFSNPDEGIVVINKTNRDWELPVFAVWSLQWPRLRRSFSFSTASFGDRRLAGEDFDLQIAPESSQRVWGRSGKPTIVVIAADQGVQKVDSEWVQASVRNLDSRQSSLKAFLLQYGSDVAEPRKAYKPLVEWFCYLRDNTAKRISGSLRAIAAAFPGPDDARTLKREAIGGILECDSKNGNALLELIAFLVASEDAAAFSSVKVDLQRCIQSLWKTKRADVLSLIARSLEAKRSEELTGALASILSAADLPTVWSEQSKILVALIQRRPDLATYPEAWAMEVDGQQCLWEGLYAKHRDSALWGRILGTMLHAKCSFSEHESVACAGVHLEEGLAYWLAIPTSTLPTSAWRNALRPAFTELVKAHELQPAVLALASVILSPDSARSISGLRSDVQSLVNDEWKSIPEWLVLKCAFWLVSVGLQTNGVAGFKIVKVQFPIVYDAVGRSQYQNESWELVEPLLPRPLFGWDWDRCRQLRRAMKEWKRRNPTFAKELENDATMEDAWGESDS